MCDLDEASRACFDGAAAEMNESYPTPAGGSPFVETRPVPLLVRLRMLFGGGFSQFAWIFFGFGMVFFWLFACRADFSSWYRFKGHLETAKGRVTASSNAGASEGGTKNRRGTPIYRNEFSYVVDDKAYHGVSYATGRNLRAGDTVTVEYAPGKPGFARIQGMRANVFGASALMVVIFPLIGLGGVVFSLVRGVSACALLAQGVPATGKLVSKEPTNRRVNKRTVYKYTFTFKTLTGDVGMADASTAANEFHDGAEEALVYDPRRPQRTLLLSSLPGSPQIREDGQIVCQRPAMGLWCSIVPLVTLIGHGWWALWLARH